MAKAKPAAKKPTRQPVAKNKPARRPAVKNKPARPPAAKKPTRQPAAPKIARAAKPTPQTEAFTAEYREYLERYELGGAGRPRLTPSEFDRLDEELLDLLALEAERGLNDEQVVRLQELEYLLLDSE